MWRINNYQRFKFRIKLPVRYNMPNQVREKKNSQNLFGNKFEREIITSLKKAVQMYNNSWIFNPLMESVASVRKIHSSDGKNNHMFHIRSGLIVLTFAFLRFKSKKILGFGIIVFIYTIYYGYCFFFVWLWSLLL